MVCLVFFLRWVGEVFLVVLFWHRRFSCLVGVRAYGPFWVILLERSGMPRPCVCTARTAVSKSMTCEARRHFCSSPSHKAKLAAILKAGAFNSTADGFFVGRFWGWEGYPIGLCWAVLFKGYCNMGVHWDIGVLTYGQIIVALTWVLICAVVMEAQTQEVSVSGWNSKAHPKHQASRRARHVTYRWRFDDYKSVTLECFDFLSWFHYETPTNLLVSWAVVTPYIIISITNMKTSPVKQTCRTMHMSCSETSTNNISNLLSDPNNIKKNTQNKNKLTNFV